MAGAKVVGDLPAHFGDLCLNMFKEAASTRVIGLAGASMSIGLLLGGSFLNSAMLPRTVLMIAATARTCSLEVPHAGCRRIDLRLLDMGGSRRRRQGRLARPSGHSRGRVSTFRAKDPLDDTPASGSSKSADMWKRRDPPVAGRRM